MAPNGSYSISEGPDPVVIICTACNRRGSYSRDRLLAKYGDIALPDLLGKVAAEAGCDLAINVRDALRCRARYELGIDAE